MNEILGTYRRFDIEDYMKCMTSEDYITCSQGLCLVAGIVKELKEIDEVKHPKLAEETDKLGIACEVIEHGGKPETEDEKRLSAMHAKLEKRFNFLEDRQTSIEDQIQKAIDKVEEKALQHQLNLEVARAGRS